MAEKSLRAAFEEQKQKAYELNYGAAQYAILKRGVESSRSLYETLQRKLKEAGISAGLASANIGLVDAAQVPSEPVEPKVWWSWYRIWERARIAGHAGRGGRWRRRTHDDSGSGEEA